MKLTKAFVTQLNTVIGQTVTFDWEHGKLWSNWCKVTGIEVHVDHAGEFTECKLFLRDEEAHKDMYPISITEIRTKEEVEVILDKISPLVYTIKGSELTLDYVEPIMKEHQKINKLLETYPEPKEEVPSDIFPDKV